jgi:peptide subunit release factor 1 (eRF1)
MFDRNKKTFISEQIIPEKPLKKNYYRCSNAFETQMLEELIGETEEYGLIMVTGSETKFYSFNEIDHKLLARIKIDLPTNTSRGGQSQARIARLREEKIHHYLKSIGERCIQFYTRDGLFNVKKFIIMGNGEMKNKLADSKYIGILNNYKIIMTLESIVPFEHIRPILDTEGIFTIDETKEIKDFEYLLEMQPNVLVFGKEEIQKCLDENLIKKILISKQMLSEIEVKDSIKVIETESYKIENFGGVVGFLYYEIDIENIK